MTSRITIILVDASTSEVGRMMYVHIIYDIQNFSLLTVVKKKQIKIIQREKVHNYLGTYQVRKAATKNFITN